MCLINRSILAQADCPHVTNVFTAFLILSVLEVSRRVVNFVAIKPLGEFPASSGILTSIATITVKIDTDTIPDNVQPPPTPCSTRELANSRINDGGNNQKLILFSRGNAISGAPICTGTR